MKSYLIEARSSMNDRQNNGMALMHGVIWKKLLLYFFPILLGTFFQQLYNTVDAWVVGNRLGDAALAAVGGTTNVLINLLVNFFIGLSSGATVLISQCYGMEDEDGVQRSVHTAVAMSIAGGALLMIVGISLARWALERMGTTADVIDNATAYLRIYFAGIIFNLLYNVGSGILRAIGDSRRPMLYLIVCCLANIVLDLLFVAVLNLGVAGAALATILSQAASAALVLITLIRAKGTCYAFHWNKLRMDMKLLPEILRIGLPAGLQSTMYNIANVIIQSNINSFGTVAMAANTAFTKIDSIFWMIINAFGITLVTFVAQNYGAQKYGRIRKGMTTCFIISASAAVFISGMMLLFGRPLLGIFTHSDDVLKTGLLMMLCETPFYLMYVPIEMFSGTMRGMGNSLGPMLTICMGVCVFRIFWLFAIVPLHKTIPMIMFSYGFSWIITSLAMLVYFCYFGKRSGLLGRERLP